MALTTWLTGEGGGGGYCRIADVQPWFLKDALIQAHN